MKSEEQWSLIKTPEELFYVLEKAKKENMKLLEIKPFHKEEEHDVMLHFKINREIKHD